MFIWYMNCGKVGSIVVVASTKEKALELMMLEPNYADGDPIERHEIEEGLVLCNTGDM